MSGWPVEEVPDAAVLFRHVHYFKLTGTGAPRPGAFKNAADGGMSTEWEKYATPSETRQRASELFDKPPAEFAVAALKAADVRSIKDQRIAHTPRPRNRSHVDVFGDKDEEVRLKLARLAKIVLARG